MGVNRGKERGRAGELQWGGYGSGDDFPRAEVGPPGSPCQQDGDEAF